MRKSVNLAALMLLVSFTVTGAVIYHKGYLMPEDIQYPDCEKLVKGIVVNGEAMPLVNLPEVEIISEQDATVNETAKHLDLNSPE